MGIIAWIVLGLIAGAIAKAIMDVIKLADWVIDLGPEAGERGGEVVGSGRPEEIARIAGSYTGQWLRNVLPGFKEFDARRPRVPRPTRVPQAV